MCLLWSTLTNGKRRDEARVARNLRREIRRMATWQWADAPAFNLCILTDESVKGEASYQRKHQPWGTGATCRKEGEVWRGTGQSADQNVAQVLALSKSMPILFEAETSIPNIRKLQSRVSCVHICISTCPKKVLAHAGTVVRVGWVRIHALIMQTHFQGPFEFWGPRIIINRWFSGPKK